MTPKKNDLTPQKAIKWFDNIRKISLRRGGDAATIPFREIRDEILAIYEDIKDLNRMQVNYGGKQ